jgi:choice-of-anchor A domain-containing protein
MQRISKALIATLGATLAGSASAAVIGPASGYNVFIFGSGSFMSQNTDTMGNLAAGGDVSLMNYAVAQGIAGDATAATNPARLVVGGKLTATNGGVGSNQNGAIYYGTATPSLTSFTARGGQFANQSLVNFGASTSLYQNLSTQLGGLAATGNTSFDANSDTLSFTGSNSGLNVFTVSAATLSASKGIDISATAGSTVLINVTGTGTASFSNGSVVESGATGAAVLYNFISATGVNLTGSKDPNGSILAPDAAVTGGFGALSGQLIAASYSGNTQFNDVEFSGTLPVPVPAAIWLFGSGLLGLGRLLGRSRMSSRMAA